MTRLSDEYIANRISRIAERVAAGTHGLAAGFELEALRELQERRAADLSDDDLRSIADTVEELRANARDWDPGEAEDALRPLLKILAAHGRAP